MLAALTVWLGPWLCDLLAGGHGHRALWGRNSASERKSVPREGARLAPYVLTLWEDELRLPQNRPSPLQGQVPMTQGPH